jgi:hypothetical protein
LQQGLEALTDPTNGLQKEFRQVVNEQRIERELPLP